MLRKCRDQSKVIGLTVAAFGAGVVVGFALPAVVLAWCEAVVLVGAGLVCLFRR